MKHLLIDCEHLLDNIPDIDFQENQHIWLLLYENSNCQLPINIVEKIFHHSANISIIRFPKIEGGNFFIFIAFQLGKISITDPNPVFKLITKQSLLIKQEELLNTLPIEISYQGIKAHVSLPPPSEKENLQPDLVTNQDFFLQVYKLVAYDLFYQKSFFPTLLHNLKARICNYYLHQFQGLYSQEEEEKIIEQVIGHFEKKDYICISKNQKVFYQLSAESIYQYLVNRIYQNRPRFYSQLMKVIVNETDFLKLPPDRLELLFEKLCQNNFLMKVDDFILYLDEDNDSENLEDIAYKISLNILANPKQTPKTITELLEKIPNFIKLNFDVNKVIYKLQDEEIVSNYDNGIINYNEKYEYELEDKFPKVLLFLCKSSHHTQPRHQETLINYIYKTFEQKKIRLYTVYLIYYRLISEGYIVINENRMIQYYLPAIESWS